MKIYVIAEFIPYEGYNEPKKAFKTKGEAMCYIHYYKTEINKKEGEAMDIFELEIE